VEQLNKKLLHSPKGLITPTPLIATFKEFFGSHPLSQFLNQINSLTEIVHKDISLQKTH